MGPKLPVASPSAQLMDGTLAYRFERRWSLFELTLPGPTVNNPAGSRAAVPSTSTV
jgi:hypothetical protein